MTQTSTITTPSNEIFSDDKASNIQQFLYYTSFVLLYISLAYISCMFINDYLERTHTPFGQIGEKRFIEKVGYVTFDFLQFPAGHLFGYETSIYNIVLFGMVLNSLLLAWILETLIIKNYSRKIKRTFILNYLLVAVLILTTIIYAQLQ